MPSPTDNALHTNQEFTDQGLGDACQARLPALPFLWLHNLDTTLRL